MTSYRGNAVAVGGSAHRVYRHEHPQRRSVGLDTRSVGLPAAAGVPRQRRDLDGPAGVHLGGDRRGHRHRALPGHPAAQPCAGTRLGCRTGGRGGVRPGRHAEPAGARHDQPGLGVGRADAAAFRATGDALLAVRDWTIGFLMSLAFLTGALLYYYVLYRARLVPRWLSGWGLVGAALSLVAVVYGGYTQEFGLSSVNTALNIPIAIEASAGAAWVGAGGLDRTTNSTSGNRALQAARLP